MDNPLIPSVKYATLVTEGDGVQTQWEFNFAGGYISPEHVKAFTEDLTTGELVIRPLTLVGTNTAQITPAVADGLRLFIYRDTPKTEPLVNYTTGSILNESSLDKSNQQAVFIAAELADRVIADYDFSNALLYAVTTATAAAATANGIDAKATAALSNSASAMTTAGFALSSAEAAAVAADNAAETANAATALLAKDFRVSKYPSLQAGIDAVEAAGGGTLWIDRPTTSGPILMDPNKVTIAGTHCIVATIDFSATATTPLAHDFMVQWRNPAKAVGRKEPFRAVTLIGPPASRKWHCLPLMSTVADGFTNYLFVGVNIIDFWIQHYYGPQSSNVSFVGCQLSQSSENFHTTTAIYAGTTYGVFNGGECWSYSNCQINNVADVLLCEVGVAGGWSFVQCALVYFRRCITLSGPAKVTIGDGSHVESGFYFAPWLTTNQNGAIIRCSNTEFWMAGNVTNYIFNSGSNTLFGGITLDNCDYHCDMSAITQWADPAGGGEISAPRWRAQDSQVRLPFGRNIGVNPEPYQTNMEEFGTTNLMLPGNTSVPNVDGSQSVDGISATVYPADTAADMIRVARRWYAKPGQNLVGYIYIKTTGFTASGGSLTVSVHPLDRYGKTLSSGNLLVLTGTDQSGWMRLPLEWYPTLPDGTHEYELRIVAPAVTVAGQPRRVVLANLLINNY